MSCYYRHGPQQPTGCNNLARSIRGARKSAGLSQADLARKAGISRAKLARWENASRAVLLADLRKIEAALECRFESLKVYRGHGWREMARQSKHGFAPAL